MLMLASFALAACEQDDGGSTQELGNDEQDEQDEQGEQGDDATEHEDAAQHCVDVINMYRASIGAPPLQRWVEAEACSDDEAASDAMTGEAHGAFGACGEFAQNECPGWPGPPAQLIDGCLELMWAEGPGDDFSQHGHYINMSNTAYSMVACGFHETENGSWWAVQNFK